jgi:hypothetical protein
MSDTVNEKTSVQEVEFDNLEDLLGVGSESIMVPSGSVDEKKPNMFSKTSTDTTFLDKPESVSTPPATPDVTSSTPAAAAEGTPAPKGEEPTLEDLSELLDQANAEGSKNPGGRPSLVKDVMVETANKLIEKGLLFPFDDGKKIEDYSAADWEELLEANIKEKEDSVKQEVPRQFYESLPYELQKAYEYVASGGTDLKNMFKALASSQEVFELDTASEDGQEQIVRTYLQTTQYGTPEEIEEEILSLRDRDELQIKAERFKPRLDQMQEQILEQKIQQQEAARKKQEEQSRMYQESVYQTLAPGSLNGIKLDTRTQNLLFSGLVQPNYPSISGKPTTMLGHLLEKYQWVEPNHELIAETLWLLADPDGYKNQIRSAASKQTVEDTVRKLKYEQANRTASSVQEEKEAAPTPGRKIQRQQRNFFGR